MADQPKPIPVDGRLGDPHGDAYELGLKADALRDFAACLAPRLSGLADLARSHAAELEHEADELLQNAPPACRVCGCTEDAACEGGCHWVDDPEMGELCSRCVDAALLVTAVDLVDGETGVRVVRKGDYAVVCSDPCHIASRDHDYAARRRPCRSAATGKPPGDAAGPGPPRERPEPHERPQGGGFVDRPHERLQGAGRPG